MSEQGEARPAPQGSPDARQVATGQRILIGAMAIVVLSLGLDWLFVADGPIERMAGNALSLASIALSIVGIFVLGHALRSPMPVRIVYAVLMVIPVVNLLILGLVNLEATKVLRDAGYKVGFLGASPP
jgi:multidrug transporter EmrE-like cation transporter